MLPSYRRSVFVALFVTALFSFAAFAFDPKRSPDSVTLRQWEEAALVAELSGDDRWFADNLHGDWTMALGTGAFLSRRDFLRDVRNGNPDVALTATIADLDVRVHGDTAVATYRKEYETRSTRDGDTSLVHVVVTDTFVRDGGRWLQLASHPSGVEPPPE